MRTRLIVLILSILSITACKNAEQIFDDYEYQSVYFSYQYPIRTITLGEDETVNTDLDNAHQCKIYATLGGVYSNTKDIVLQIAVDNNLTDNLLFTEGGNVVEEMPSTYYSLATNTITIPKGEITGAVEVQLYDAFFDDPKSLENNYVIPLKITSVSNADSILSEKNFTLYAIKYINKWHGYYLRRGIDKYTSTVDNTSAIVNRKQQYVEDDDVEFLTSMSLNALNFPVTYEGSDGNNVTCTLVLSFTEDGNCTITSGTPNVTASGSGKFVSKGDKNSWGNKDRDALYLTYNVGFGDMKVNTTDTLVMRNRGVGFEIFSPVGQ